MPLLIAVIFFVPVALEGVGIMQNRLLVLLSFLLVPMVLYLTTVFTTTRLRMPSKFSIALLLFFIFSNISALFFSWDKQTSFEWYLYYVSLVLVFLFSYNHQPAVKKALPWLIVFLGSFFSLYSLIIHSARNGGQVVYPFYSNHNHLGDFLGFVLAVLASVRFRKTRYRVAAIMLSLFFFILIVFSYSRSAYLAVFVTAVVFLWQKRDGLSRKYLLAGTAVCILVMAAFFASSSAGLAPDSPFYAATQLVEKYLHFTPKDIFSGRDVYFSQAIGAIAQRPAFGIGVGNYVKISLQHNVNNNYTDSAHNIFLEVAAEQGIPAAASLLLICMLLLRAAWKRNKLWGLAIFYLIINFQTDYTYQIYLFPFLAALWAGAHYEENESLSLPYWVYGITGMLLFIAIFCIATSMLFVQFKRPLEAARWYPLSKDAYIMALQQETNPANAKRLIRSATQIAPNDLGVLLETGKYLYRNNQKKEALAVFEQLYEGNSLVNFSVIKYIYVLKRDVQSRSEAERFLNEVMSLYRRFTTVPDVFKNDVFGFCKAQGSHACDHTVWY